MAWKQIVTDNFFPSAESLIYNELGSLMALNEDLVSNVEDNFWGIPREYKGSPNPRQDYLRDNYYKQADNNPQDKLLVYLSYGATRSGKTVGIIALITEILVKFPGTKALGVDRKSVV